METKVDYGWLKVTADSDDHVGPATNMEEARTALAEALSALTSARFDELRLKHQVLTAKNDFDQWTVKVVAQAWEDGDISGSNEKARQLSRDLFLADHAEYQGKADEIKAMDLAAALAGVEKDRRLDAYKAACLVVQSFTAEYFNNVAIA